MNLNILPVGDELQLQPQEVHRLTLRKMTNIRQHGESALRRDINKHCTAGNRQFRGIYVGGKFLGIRRVRDQELDASGNETCRRVLCS